MKSTEISKRQLLNADGQWIRVTSPSIPNYDSSRAIGYNANDSMVWLLGGIGNSHSLISFNTSNNSYTDYGDILTANISAASDSFIQKDNIFILLFQRPVFADNCPSEKCSRSSVLLFSVQYLW